jgi:hypothetical protein
MIDKFEVVTLFESQWTVLAHECRGLSIHAEIWNHFALRRFDHFSGGRGGFGQTDRGVHKTTKGNQQLGGSFRCGDKSRWREVISI